MYRKRRAAEKGSIIHSMITVIKNAKEDLGDDLGGLSLTDLLLDNFPISRGEAVRLIERFYLDEVK